LLGVSALSAYAAIRIGIDIKNGISDSVNENTLVNLVGASTIAAGNTYAYKQVRKVEIHSHASRTSLNHAQVDMAASWGLATSLVLEAAGANNASEYGGGLFAAYTAGHLALHALKPHDH
jgi:hypothetical protein